ncbi:MAG: hypothetical protein J0M18_13575 [Ignavibacteria bacterium]|nr:hypothetical protein [Ignavibacteria bacterium]
MKTPLKFLLLSLFFLLFFSIARSQSSDLYLLELNNGIAIKCYLKEYTENKELIVISEEGKEIKVQLEEVKKFVKIDQKVFDTKDVTPNYERRKISYLPRNVWSNTIKMGPMRNNKNDKFYFSASDIVNYELGEISLGAGVSYDAIPDNAFIPVFADLKYNFNTYSSSIPFIFGNAGYSFTTDIGSGYMFALGVGLKSKFSGNINLIADLSYKYQRIQFTETIYGYTFKFVGNTNYITANVGIQF